MQIAWLESLKFGQLTLRKMIKIVATRCQILRPKCTKFNFSWGSAPDPAGGAYSAPPDTLAGLREATSKGGEGKEQEGEGSLGRAGGRDPTPSRPPLIHISGYAPGRLQQNIYMNKRKASDTTL